MCSYLSSWCSEGRDRQRSIEIDLEEKQDLSHATRSPDGEFTEAENR
jgi:hypothetical protein